MADQRSAAALFEPLKLGAATLKHRVVLAPLTRCRAIDTIPAPEPFALYYSQRATDGGLLIAEATCVTPGGHGYPHTPGIYTRQQVDAWKPVVEAVHAKGGIFYSQLWHVGRASHNNYQPDGGVPMSASDVPVTGEDNVVWTPQGGPFQYPAPRPLTEREIAATVQAYADCARNAIAAGFDGVEIHAANGYLIAQFVSSLTNKRTDKYGGSLENRCRFLFEVVDAVVEAVGAAHVGIRLSPFNRFLDCVEPEPYETYGYIVKELNKHRLAYVHMVEPRVYGNADIEPPKEQSLAPFREACDTVFISAGGHKRESGIAAVESHAADLVAYGRWFISNPDLPQRLKLGAPLTPYDRDTFYSQEMVKGYTDYPALSDAEVAELEAAAAKLAV